MANTAIVLVLEEGVLVPSQPSVPFVNGDSVSFSVADGSPGFLFFSPAATAALEPTPTNPYALDGSKAEFSFLTSESRPVQRLLRDCGVRGSSPVSALGSSSLLLLEIDDAGAGFGGPDHGTKPGRTL